MSSLENDLRRIRIGIIARVGLYYSLALFVFLFVAVKIDLIYGMCLILVLLLVLLFYAIPAYRKRLDLGMKFCADFWKLSKAIPPALKQLFGSSSKGEVRINIYSFDSEFRVTIDSSLEIAQIDEDCWAISNKFGVMLKEYEMQQKVSTYVNFDALLVGMTALWFIDYHTQGLMVLLKLHVRGYNEYFSFNGDNKGWICNKKLDN